MALGVLSGAVTGERAARLLQHAAYGAAQCFGLYNETATGLGAEQARYGANGHLAIESAHYHQRPEVR